MSRKIQALALLVVCAILWPGFAVEAKRDNLPRLPGAALLLGHPGRLVVTTPKETFALQRDDEDSAWQPSMSRDGSVVAATRVKSKNPLIVVVQTYSIAERKWIERKEIKGLVGAIAISADGSKLAFASQELGPSTSVRLHFLDLISGTEGVSSAIGLRYPGTLSWSPDARRIVFDVDVNRSPADTVPMIPTLRPAIYILDLETGRVSKIADGRAPAWSPSGEWIAYLHYSADKENPELGSGPLAANQACVIHPDGTGLKVLATLGKSRMLGILFPEDRLFWGAPVWSPDSTKLLLNEYTDWEKFTFDMHLLDLATLKMTRKFKGTQPAYGWAVAE